MRLDLLRIEDLRCLRAVELAPGAGCNLLLGPNGSGKTSVLEAIHLLTHGRSFRSGGHAALRAHDADAYQVFGAWTIDAQRQHRIGMRHDGQSWRLRVDGEHAASLGAAIGLCASTCFEPGSHALISGAARLRRRFLDWGVFHVEHAFLAQWQRYQRALRQRNVLLRQGGDDAQLRDWEVQMAAAGELVSSWRHAYVEALLPQLLAEADKLTPELGASRLRFLRGWAADEPLAEALARSRPRDRDRGHTRVGPQRADWRLQFEHVQQHDHLSRGQEKLVALACVLAQTAHYTERHDHWPVVCLDDLASELDRPHQERLVERLFATDAQIWITGTETPDALQEREVCLFHVEHGQVRAA